MSKVKVKICSTINHYQTENGVKVKHVYFRDARAGTEVEIDQEDLDFIDFANEIQEEAQRIYKNSLGNEG